MQLLTVAFKIDPAMPQKKRAAIESPGDESMLSPVLYGCFPDRPKAIAAELVSHSLFYDILRLSLSIIASRAPMATRLSVSSSSLDMGLISSTP